MQVEPPLTVTMVNTVRLAEYSTERYYMLSELEQQASSIEFLCDLTDSQQVDDDAVPPKTKSSLLEKKADDDLYVILYLLWRPNTYPSARSFVEGPVIQHIKHILKVTCDDDVELLFAASSPSTSPKQNFFGDANVGRRRNVSSRASYQGDDSGRDLSIRTKIYVCIDRVSPPPSSPAQAISLHEEESVYNEAQAAKQSVDEQARLRQHAVETQISEEVAKAISTHPQLRGMVGGVSVGTTAEVRAAPGLEVCLKAVSYGSAERRRGARALRNADATLSPICLMCPHPDDMVGLDPNQETDAVQGIVQSLTVSEWNGHGDAVCFASRVMDSWRKKHDFTDGMPSGSPGRASPRSRRRRGRHDRSSSANIGGDNDIMMTLLVALAIAGVAYMWTRYSESAWTALSDLIRSTI